MALTAEDVLNQKFTITKFRDGYDLDQVDEFLDKVAEEFARREAEAKELQDQVAELTAKLTAAEEKAESAEQQAAQQTIVVDAQPASQPQPAAEQPAPGVPGADAIKSSAMLQLALELHDKYVHEGETTRDNMIAEAEAKRDEMLSDAERTVNNLIEEAQKQRAEELKQLGIERSDLQYKIKELRQFENEYRSTLRSYIQSQLRGLDGSPEPAGAPDEI